MKTKLVAISAFVALALAIGFMSYYSYDHYVISKNTK
jgi:hypothetical protein